MMCALVLLGPIAGAGLWGMWMGHLFNNPA